jgi:hypothetical protein
MALECWALWIKRKARRLDVLQGVDALAGVEAVISHMVVENFGIPCAHAPALAPLSLQEVSPRSAAEEVSRRSLDYYFIFNSLSGPSLSHNILHPSAKFIVFDLLPTCLPVGCRAFRDPTPTASRPLLSSHLLRFAKSFRCSLSGLS